MSPAITGLQADSFGTLQPTAGDMRQMEWDEAIAKTAQSWADNCVYEHRCAQRSHVRRRSSLVARLNIDTARARTLPTTRRSTPTTVS